MWIIVGLGNPGIAYRKSRHNAGFNAIDALSQALHIRVAKRGLSGIYGEGLVNGERVVLVKPQTYMNLSGDCVQRVLHFFKTPPEHLIVMYDDIDLPVGALRIRASGSAGTHNGMRNIVECLNGNTAFKRIRIGTGFDHGNVPLYNVVLSKVKGENKTLVDASTDFVANELLSFLKDGDFDKLMRNVNGFKPE